MLDEASGQSMPTCTTSQYGIAEHQRVGKVRHQRGALPQAINVTASVSDEGMHPASFCWPCSRRWLMQTQLWPVSEVSLRNAQLNACIIHVPISPNLAYFIPVAVSCSQVIMSCGDIHTRILVEQQLVSLICCTAGRLGLHLCLMGPIRCAG